MLWWYIRHLIGKTEGVVLYCANVLDYEIFAPVQKHLKPLPIVAKDKKTQLELAKMGISASCLPSFPEGVIMCRQAAYRFPVKSIKKIGLRHGAYHFKPFANADSYNLHDCFLMTSRSEVEHAQAAGIHCGIPVGYPKLDCAFDGSINTAKLNHLGKKTGLDVLKKNILFTATWDKSGISAIAQWADKLASLTEQYNVLVSVHPWTTIKYIEQIKNTQGVFYLGSRNILPFIVLSDVCIGDASSILAECCALDKPIITFNLPERKRSVPHVLEMIRDFSLQIDGVSNLETAIQQCLATPNAKQAQRAEAARIMFDELDGQAGKRAANEIIKYFPHLKND